MSTAEAVQGPFSARALFWGIFASLLAAAGFFLLATYAPDFRSGGQGGASPTSLGGAGYAGLFRLLKLTDHAPVLARHAEDWETEGLLVVTIPANAAEETLDRIVAARADLPTLFVLPKWETAPLPGHSGWEARTGRVALTRLNEWMSHIADGKIADGQGAAGVLDIDGHTIPAPWALQWVAAEEALVCAGSGKGVLTYGRDYASYVLSDPDLLNNAALADAAKAQAALALIDWLRPEGEPVVFDFILHGGEATHDLGKLLVEPPFLALTLTVLVAAALAFLHGLVRFGPPAPEGRAIPFGKRALADATALLLRRAGRLESLGGRYAALARSRAATLLGAPPELEAAALDRWLDARGRTDAARFSSLAHAAEAATTSKAVLAASRALHDWVERRSGERR